MAKAVRQRKINHTNNILDERNFRIGNLLKGMILRFAYNSPNVYDRRPMVLYLGPAFSNKKEISDTISGINLNYLMESKVQEMFTWTLKLFEGRYHDAFRHDSFYNLDGEFTRIGFSERISPSDVDVPEFMNRYVNPRLLAFPATKNCFRTYKKKYISQLKVIDFKISVLEKYEESSNQFAERFLELGGKIVDGTMDLSTKELIEIYNKTKKEFGV
jgi:hypothetical protein